MTRENINKLLSGLSGPGVNITVEELAKFTAKNGVNAEIHVGRRRGYIQLPQKALGLKPEKMTDDCRDFYSKHIDLGKISFIPKEPYEKELTAVEGSIRRKCAAKWISGIYMPMESYKVLREEFAEARTEYFAKADEVCAHWDELVQDFKIGVAIMLKGAKVLKRDKGALFDAIIREIPSKEEYRASFKMDLSVTAYPVDACSVDGIESSIRQDLDTSYQDELFRTAADSIEIAFGTAFSTLCKAADSFDRKGLLTPRYISMLEESRKRIVCSNIFRNPLLTDISSTLENIPKCTDDLEMVEIVEDCIVIAYCYAKETGIKLDMSSCPLDKDAIENLVAIKKKTNGI